MINESLLEPLVYSNISIKSYVRIFYLKLLIWFILMGFVLMGYSLYIYLPYSLSATPSFSGNAEVTFRVSPVVLSFTINVLAFPFTVDINYDENCITFKEYSYDGYKIYVPYNYSESSLTEGCFLNFKYSYELPYNLNKDIVIQTVTGFKFDCIGDYAFWTTGYIGSDGNILSKQDHQGCSVISGVNEQNIYLAGSMNSFLSHVYQPVGALFFCLSMTSFVWLLVTNVVNKINDRLRNTRTIRSQSIKGDQIILRV